MAEKTHDPTAKRIRDARAKGDVPSAPLVAAAVGLLALVPLSRGAITKLTGDLSRTLLDLAPIERIEPWSLAMRVVSPTLPFVIVLGGVAVVAAIAQGNVTWSTSRLSPDPTRLNPFGGLKQLVDKGRWWGALRGLLLAIALAALLGRLVLEASVVGARSLETSRALAAASRFASRAVITAGALACAVALVDVIVARRLWLGRHRMSRDEVMREHKESEGDPEVKRQREELHHELLAAEALSAVRDATVVVINPTHLACALKYDDKEGEDAAPTLTAKGQGALAARMIEAAKLHGVPVIRDVPVARALYDLEVGTEIPEALYEAVAEVLRAAWEGD